MLLDIVVVYDRSVTVWADECRRFGRLDRWTAGGNTILFLPDAKPFPECHLLGSELLRWWHRFPVYAYALLLGSECCEVHTNTFVLYPGRLRSGHLLGLDFGSKGGVSIRELGDYPFMDGGLSMSWDRNYSDVRTALAQGPGRTFGEFGLDPLSQRRGTLGATVARVFAL